MTGMTVGAAPETNAQAERSWQSGNIERHPTSGLFENADGVGLRLRREDFEPLRSLFEGGEAAGLSDAGWLADIHHSQESAGVVTFALEGVVPPLRAHEATPSYRRDAGLAFLSLFEALASHGLTLFDCDLESFLPDHFGRPKFFDLQRIVPAGPRKFPYRSFFAHVLGPLLLVEQRPDLAELLCRPPSCLFLEHYLEITAPRRARFLRHLEFGSPPARAAHRALLADPLAGLLHVGEYGSYLRGLPEEYRWAGRERPTAPCWTASLVSALRRRLNRMRFGGMVLRKWQRYQSGHDMAALVRAGNDWQRFGETDQRTRTILGELKKLSPTTLTDIGANKGYFSYMAAHLGFDVTALDHGVTMMESITNTLAAADYPLPIRTAAVDLSRIEIDDCWRLRSDVVIALSVTHHLRLASRMPWQRIAAVLSALAERVLLVEFKASGMKLTWPAPPSAMLAEDYRLENFTGALEKWFPDIRVDDSYAAEANGRTLIVCRRERPAEAT